LVVWLVGWLVGRLVGWLVGCNFKPMSKPATTPTYQPSNLSTIQQNQPFKKTTPHKASSTTIARPDVQSFNICCTTHGSLQGTKLGRAARPTRLAWLTKPARPTRLPWLTKPTKPARPARPAKQTKQTKLTNLTNLFGNKPLKHGSARLHNNGGAALPSIPGLATSYSTNLVAVK